MTEIHEPNEELVKELRVLQRKYNSLKALYNKHLCKRKILQELSRENEEKLNESNALLQIAKEKTKIGGWVRNLRKNQVYWSDGVTDILEMPLGHKPQLDEAISFYAPQWRDKIKEALTNCEQEGISFDEEMEIITAKGKQVWIRVIGEADRDDDGNIVKVNGTFQDISERKFAENQLQKLSMAVKQSPVSIFLTDIEGNIEYVNPKVIEITGYTLEELIGKNPKVFSAGQTPKSIYKKLWTTIASGKEWHGEFHNKKKNGEFYWELASISPIFNQNGKITNYLAVKEDITDRKQKEVDLIIANEELAFQNEEKEKRAAELIVANQELVFQNCEKEKRAAELIVAKERAEESDKLKSAFLANLSHEIRTPMNGILGFTELLKEPDLSSEKQQKFINIIQKSGARLLNIINDIIDISKIEAGEMQTDIKLTNIKEQIEYCYTFFKPEVEKKGLQLLVNNSSLEEDLMIETDREKIYAIFSNLIKNAIKFTNKGSVLFGYERKVEYLEFYVKDTGIGIPKDKLEAIFKRFIQADISNDMAIQGAGLGLSISKAYVELLGGKIWVESEVENLAIGKAGGSAFYFTIPYKQVR